MTDDSGTQGDRRQKKDRRSGTDRRSGRDRRSSTDRRSDEDRREGWGKIEDQRLLGALTTAATVAHLFSQPLTIIIGHVDLLLSTIEDSVTRNKLEIIKEQLQALSMTLQDLRSATRSSHPSGSRPGHLLPVCFPPNRCTHRGVLATVGQLAAGRLQRAAGSK